MSLHYDSLPLNADILLDLPFREGIGALYTRDVAKPHHVTTMVGAPTWTELETGLTTLAFDGDNQYIWGTAAATEDLGFTDGDYSLGGWFYIATGGRDDKTLACRFKVSENGWELYHYTNEILTLRHHHAAGASLRTAAYSEEWAYDKWWFLGLSRSGSVARFWRGDVDGFAELTTFSSVGGLIDPETSDQNFFIGTDTTGTNDFNGKIWRPRIWERAVSGAEWAQEYERTKGWFA